MAVATLSTAGGVALSGPAQAGTGAVSVPGLHVSHDAGHAATGHRPVGGEDDEDEVVSTKKDCKKCPPGPPGPPGPSGRTDGVDSAMATPTGLGTLTPVTYIGLAQPNGIVLVRDPTSVGPANPPWHDLSTVPNHPANATDVTLAANPTGNQLQITVRSRTGLVRQTTCALGVNVTWPANCTAFADLTPPL
ncbi:hypothetical protein [Sphaerisporangium album]|uniref:hypothetical protein n=1 Tax=Sphaerisporangium album TaxID=509200 RepID=UPI0011C049F4|nr:hypothetical protein [Sphaerisporangium album]